MAFNDFDLNLENAARLLLVKYSEQTNIQYVEIPAESSNGERGFTRDRAGWLRNQSPDSVVDQIMIYALVTLVQSNDFEGRQSQLASIHETLRKNNWAITKAFVRGGKFEQNGLRVGLGCFEFRKQNLWGMYKANWSASIGRDQC